MKPPAAQAGRNQHEELGFHEGWGQCLDQLVAHVKKMQAARKLAIPVMKP
jgi:hypothetical protein